MRCGLGEEDGSVDRVCSKALKMLLVETLLYGGDKLFFFVWWSGGLNELSTELWRIGEKGVCVRGRCGCHECRDYRLPSLQWGRRMALHSRAYTKSSQLER